MYAIMRFMNGSEELHNIRHSLAHLLAMAALELYPDAKLTLGPAIENGFYYDIEFSGGKNPSSDDLKKLERKMKKLVSSKLSFAGREVAPKEAREIFASNSYKLELIDEIVERGEKVTLYSTGKNFTDLCRGGHVENTSEINSDAFTLTHIAGVYWRGDEKNTMLTRIYGLAFETPEALAEYQKMQEEAKKRDHRKLGKELGLFAFDDDVGPGLPLWLPKGAAMIEALESLAKETEFHAGYDRVRTPHIAKESMYLTSGHLPYYQDSMYPPMEYEGEKYYLKAMNCPHHHKIFAAEPRSYRDLPMRLAEYGTVYRHEKSGELFGIMRVRMMQMNDAHIYCSEEQFAGEFRRVNEMYLKYFKIFGITKYMMRLSLHDPEKLGKKYVNEPELWMKTEEMVRKVLADSKTLFTEVPDEAAFYGPKIDVEVWSAIGREFTLATNQVDFSVPKRFGLTFTNREGKPKTPLCIHRAPLGTHERFIGFLIEHYGGAFPFWLAPVQTAVLPISEKHHEYAKSVFEQLKEKNIRAELWDQNESLGKKIRNVKLQKIPYFLVIGDKEVKSKTVTIEDRGKGSLGQKDIHTFLDLTKGEGSV